MKQDLDLDFARQCKPFSRVWMWLVAAILSLLLIGAVYQWQQMQSTLAAQAALTASYSQSTPKVSSQLNASIQLAHETQYALNIPWDTMLAALEKAQEQTPEMRLLSIQPQPKRLEVMVSGVVSDFSVLAQYIAALKEQAEFSDAVLVSQRWEEAEIGEVSMHFRLAVRWQL